MITEKRLEELAGIESDEGIVSLYLRLEPSLMYERGLPKTKFKSAWTRFERRESSDAWKAAARRERGRIEEYLDEWTPSGRGLAIFACEPLELFHVVPLAVSVPTSLSVDRTTHTRPLTLLLDEFPRVAVCVVQRDKAHIYGTEQREADDGAEVESEVPGKHAAGGWSQARFERHVELHVEKHLEEVVRELEKLHEKKPFDRLVLGGTAAVTSEFEQLLPERLKSLLIGSVPVNVKHESEEELLEKARALSTEAEREEERELVEKIVEESGGGGRGALGLESTLRALVEGRIHKLVLLDDLEEGGWECSSCDYLAATEFRSCPLCEAEGEPAENVVDVAVERAFVGGAEVNFVFEGPAREQLAEKGSVGALLRF